MTDPPPEQHPLLELRAHLHSAHDAARRLMQQATETPSWGWESDEAEQATGAADQARALSELLHSLRELLPEDVRAQLAELIRALLEVLLALLELLRRRLSTSEPQQSSTIQDIPI
ncbi:MAG: hypothetical protein ACRDK2_04070 [Solirubrobacteraceae bacterium]